jgi:hypothetical protein
MFWSAHRSKHLFTKTINCEQSSEAHSLILEIHKVLTAEGTFANKVSSADVVGAGRLR